MYGYIYETTNLINGKKYLGQHKSKYFDSNYKGSGKYLWNAINKYGWDNFIVKMLCPCFSPEELDAEEIFIIEYTGAVDSEDYYNIAAGGRTGAVYLPQEIRDTLRDKQLEIWSDPAYKAKMHEARLGNQNSAGKIWIHCGDNTSTRVNPDYLEEFLKEGWVLGCTPESTEKKRLASIGRQNNLGKVRIHKDGEGRMVNESELLDYLDKGYELGQNPEAVRKRIGYKYSDRTYNLICKYCGKSFIGSSPRIYYCSDDCKSKYKTEHPGPDTRLIGRKYNLNCKRCGRKFIARSPAAKKCNECKSIN